MILRGRLVLLQDDDDGQFALVRCQRGSRFPDGNTEQWVSCVNGVYKDWQHCYGNHRILPKCTLRVST